MQTSMLRESVVVMSKKGAKGAPTAANFRRAARQLKKIMAKQDPA